MTPETPVAAPAPSAPAATVTPSAPPAAPNTLAEFRAQKHAPPAAAEPAKEPPIASDLPPRGPVELEAEPAEPADEPEPQEASPQGPQLAAHRWKDPDTGVPLDLRRRDHRRIKRLLEERSELARRVYQSPAAPPQAQPPQPQDVAPDPNDPEPTLEQFADHPDPYGAYIAAHARYAARQEFRQLQASHTRVERERQVRASIDQAQRAYDAELPKAKERYPDFDDAHGEVLAELGRLPMQARAPIVHRLLTSPIRHDLTHYLGSHPDDLAAVTSARSAYEQGLVLGAIETRVRALVNQRKAPAPPPTPAPAPIAPVGGNASSTSLPDGKSMSLAQFRANKARLGFRG